MVKNVLITGTTGMAGSHLADQMLEKGHKVYGLIRRNSSPNIWRIQHIINDIELIEGDLTDSSSLCRAIKLIKPDLVFNMAAQSHVKHSFEAPITTADITGLGVLRLLEALRVNYKDAKIYQASSSEQFGKVLATPQTELTPFYPRSPYACAKVFAYWIMKNYRESYNMFICNGIKFNMESERRGIEFVTRKITDGVARIKLGIADKIVLGNLDSKRDWGSSEEYMEVAYKILMHNEPDDYVVATGEVHSVKEWLIEAFKCVDIIDWEKYIEQDERYMRPSEVDYLCGDASKAKLVLGWEPKKKFKDIVKIMVDADMERLKKEK